MCKAKEVADLQAACARGQSQREVNGEIRGDFLEWQHWGGALTWAGEGSDTGRKGRPAPSARITPQPSRTMTDCPNLNAFPRPPR